MPRRSRRTISDAIRCINKNSSCFDIDVSIMASGAILQDDDTNLLSILGLPRKNHCAIYYNNALFILKGQSIESSLAITFTNDSFLASSTQFPSIQWIENNNTQQETSSICTVTSYGQAIILHPTRNDTIDLNTRHWTLTLSSSPSPPTNFSALAVANMKDDMILVLGHNNNNNALSTWLLDASDDQLQWTWTQLTSPFSFLLRNENSTLISTSMTTTTSYILYFGVHQPTRSTFSYDVSVYCFDISSLTWIGSLLNFTSTTNHIQSVMINNNTSNNDTLLILPDWIDTTIIHATSSDINVTYAQSQQIQQHQGFWILTIDASPSSPLPVIDFAWQPNNMETTSGGSITVVGKTVVFYGGDTRSLTSSMGANLNLRFWNISDHSFLATPAWLAPFFLPSTPTANPTFSPILTADTNDEDNKVIIILATFLGIFGLAFLCLLAFYLWRRKKEPRQDNGTTRQMEEQQERAEHQHGTPRIDQHDNAATWANQLHRSFSAILQRLRPAPPLKRNIPTVAGLAISSPLEAVDSPSPQPEQQQQQHDKDSSPPPLMSSSNITNSAPQSTRNSWQEGSMKTSRFVEHF